MNKKGTLVFVYFMIGVIFFLLGLALAPSLSQTIDEARTDLNCSSSSITNQDKAICYQMDSLNPLFVGLLFGLSGVILGRMVL